MLDLQAYYGGMLWEKNPDKEVKYFKYLATRCRKRNIGLANTVRVLAYGEINLVGCNRRDDDWPIVGE